MPGLVTWTPERRARLRDAWGKVSVRDFAAAEQTSAGAVYRIARQLGLETKERAPQALRRSHPAIRDNSTRYPGSIISAKKSKRVLVSGKENRKLGHRVTKGRWRGLTIYSLTLVERASCPANCLEWSTCYGNALNWPKRLVLDDELTRRLDVELDMLAACHPSGFLVRLHVLGDFGANAREGLPYVEFWERRLRDTPELHVFGFTAHDPLSPVGAAIMSMNREFPGRVRIRFSGTTSDDGFGATVIDDPAESQHVVCPFESDHPKRPKDCAGCGLCWTMDRTVEFVRH